MFKCPKCGCREGYHGYSPSTGVYSCHATADGRHPNEVDGVMYDTDLGAFAAARSLGLSTPKPCGWKGRKPDEQEPTPEFLDAMRRAGLYIERKNEREQ